jgi:uncharacterized protein (DUF983 family)
MIGRALVLRCPRCGGRGIRRSWFKFKHACPTCELAFERGESEDYWLGAYMFNLVVAELVSVGIAVVVIVAVWPDVPWNLVWALSVVLAIAMPILFFPFSRDLWLAFDLMFRPTEPDHVTEHRTAPRAH